MVVKFSIRLEDPQFDESEHARRVARHVGTRHVEQSFSESDLLNILSSKGTLESKCRQLIAAARSEGGPDNITAVLLKTS